MYDSFKMKRWQTIDLSAHLISYPVTYILTHDSICVELPPAFLRGACYFQECVSLLEGLFSVSSPSFSKQGHSEHAAYILIQ